MRYAQEGPSESNDGTVRFDYQARRPFHPTRLHTLLAEAWSGVLRAKGNFWVASRPEVAATLDLAGGSRTTSVTGTWWSAVSADQRPNSPEFRQYMEEIWHPDFGDRHQDFSIVGVGVDEDELRARLDQCLLTDEELADPNRWTSMPDPFRWPKGNR